MEAATRLLGFIRLIGPIGPLFFGKKIDFTVVFGREVASKG
jgi:hypothetical protein